MFLSGLCTYAFGVIGFDEYVIYLRESCDLLFSFDIVFVWSRFDFGWSHALPLIFHMTLLLGLLRLREVYVTMSLASMHVCQFCHSGCTQGKGLANNYCCCCLCYNYCCYCFLYFAVSSLWTSFPWTPAADQSWAAVAASSDPSHLFVWWPLLPQTPPHFLLGMLQGSWCTLHLTQQASFVVRWVSYWWLLWEQIMGETRCLVCVGRSASLLIVQQCCLHWFASCSMLPSSRCRDHWNTPALPTNFCWRLPPNHSSLCWNKGHLRTCSICRQVVWNCRWYCSLWQ